MNLADTRAFADELRARRATHWVVCIVSPVSEEYREMPRETKPRLMLGGFIPADMLDGATVYVHGAVAPLLQGAREMVAHPDHVRLAAQREKSKRGQATGKAAAAGKRARARGEE